ncbi:hypothetical protein [Streptomyces tauricus]|uniref:hypothetical protein n=1 Tax=Streptomyces tauricus TaxID=68274 RepID=UPI0037FC6495
MSRTDHPDPVPRMILVFDAVVPDPNKSGRGFAWLTQARYTVTSTRLGPCSELVYSRKLANVEVHQVGDPEVSKPASVKGWPKLHGLPFYDRDGIEWMRTDTEVRPAGATDTEMLYPPPETWVGSVRDEPAVKPAASRERNG